MPEYTVHPGDIMIKFTGPEDRIIRVSNWVPDKVPDGVSDKVTIREKQILVLLTEDLGNTKPVLAEKMSVSRKTVGEHLKSLKDKGIIERIGSARNGYWKIK